MKVLSEWGVLKGQKGVGDDQERKREEGVLG